MDVGDAVFGIGNWILTKYFLWVVLEGVVVPRYNGVKDRGQDSITRSLNNSFYQGILQFYCYVIVSYS